MKNLQKEGKSETNLAQKDFTCMWTVDVRSVKKSDSTVDGMVDQFNQLMFGLRGTRADGHAQASQALC